MEVYVDYRLLDNICLNESITTADARAICGDLWSDPKEFIKHFRNHVLAKIKLDDAGHPISSKTGEPITNKNLKTGKNKISDLIYSEVDTNPSPTDPQVEETNTEDGQLRLSSEEANDRQDRQRGKLYYKFDRTFFNIDKNASDYEAAQAYQNACYNLAVSEAYSFFDEDGKIIDKNRNRTVVAAFRGLKTFGDKGVCIKMKKTIINGVCCIIEVVYRKSYQDTKDESGNIDKKEKIQLCSMYYILANTYEEAFKEDAKIKAGQYPYYTALQDDTIHPLEETKKEIKNKIKESLNKLKKK